MKFATITEFDLINNAYNNILEKWVRESDRFALSIEQGRPSYIAQARRDKYKKQLDELHTAIVKMEQKGRKESEKYNNITKELEQ